MSTITKERIELFIKNPLDNGLTRGEQMEVARIALASLTAASDERAAFETFMEKRFNDCIDRRLVKNGDGEYFAWDMQVSWIVWQGRAAMLHGAEQWIPCSERMPEEEQGSVIGWNAETCEVGEYFYDNDEFECFSYYNFCGYHSFNADVVTHWMPLPSSPQKESGNG